MSHEGFPFASCRTIEVGSLRVLASRISYVGDLGWELYVPIEQGAKLWDAIREAGEPHGIVPAGIGVYGTTGRLEKCYRAFGFELDGEYDVVEAGMAWGKVKEQDFVGKEAHVRHREEEPAARDVHAHGRRPHLRERREALHAGRRADRDAVTARRSPTARAAARSSRAPGRARRWASTSCSSYLPPEHAVVGEQLAVEYMNERYPGDRRARRLHAAVRPGQRAGEGGGPGPDMRILVCVKRVPLTGGRMVLTADEQAIETRHLGFTISPHEECGVEEAVRLVEAHGGSVTVLTLGPPEAEEQVRDMLAVGADRGVLLVNDSNEEWDPQGTASAVVAAVSAEEASGGPFDLIVFGNESADSGGYQVGIRVAHALGRPIATGLKGLSIEDGRARCEQEVQGGRDVYLVPLPAVVSVLEGINLPRYPSVPAKLRARSKPVEKSTPERPEPRLEKLRLVVPPGQGKQAEVLGQGPEAAPQGGRDHARDRASHDRAVAPCGPYEPYPGQSRRGAWPRGASPGRAPGRPP